MTTAEVLRRIVDDVLTNREQHGLSDRVAREIQLAAQAITHERFRVVIAELGRAIEREATAERTPGT